MSDYHGLFRTSVNYDLQAQFILLISGDKVFSH